MELKELSKVNLMTELLISSMVTGLPNVDVEILVNKFNLYKKDTMSLNESYTLLLEICDEMLIMEQDYDKLGVRILFNMVKLSNAKLELWSFCDRQNYINAHLKSFMCPTYIKYINANSHIINDLYEKYSGIPSFMTIFGFKTLFGAYMISVNKTVIENPIDVFLRCAIGLWYSSDSALSNIESTIQYMYEGKFTHATPTLFNSGTINNQLSSCFVVGMDDNIDAIYKNLLSCAQISKKCGGIGFSVSNVRASGSVIASSNGETSGLVTMLRPYNTTAYYVNQGGKGSKRSGAFVAFLEPWHADVVSFVESKLQNGDEYNLLRDLFIGLWIPDLFMKQLEIDGDWYLMCPNESPGLYDLYGEQFETKYWDYVKQGLFRRVMKASELMHIIRKTISESGQPYMMFKDNVNRRSNQSNMGTIRSSNLCCEITEVSGYEKHSVCNLASISVNKFLESDNTYNFTELMNVSKQITRNLNRCIDINSYPTTFSMSMNKRSRPIGIGIQGLGNLLQDMKIPYESTEALAIESRIMETIYYGALTESCNLAKINGAYEYFPNSPFSKGIFQMDMIPDFNYSELMHDWTSLRNDVMRYGTVNSLLTALMPTASTSQILGNTECFEPISSNCYIRKTSSGSFKCINYNLINDLKSLGLWNVDLKNKLVEQKGSIQNIPNIPNNIKALYKTVWEIKQRWMMDHAIARSPFVDQSQSMNLYFETVTKQKFTSAMMYAWKNGLKTGSYYTKTQSSHDATDKVISTTTFQNTGAQCTESCESCSA